MSIKSLCSENLDQLNQQILDLKSVGFEPTLGICFVNDRMIEPKISELFKKHNIQVMGACCSEGIETDRVYKKNIVTLLIEIPKEFFKIHIIDPNLDEIDIDSFIYGNELRKLAQVTFDEPALLLLVAPGDLQIKTEKLLEGIFSEDNSIPVFGGLASSLGVLRNPPIFDQNNLYALGIACLIIDQTFLNVQGITIGGWTELGTEKKITKSSANVVYEIDGIPATEYYYSYFNIAPPKEKQAFNNLNPDLLAASEYPILITKADGSRVVRAAIKFDMEEKTVHYGGDIPQYANIRFCSPNLTDTMMNTLNQMIEFKEARISDCPDGILLFNCAVRSRAFGPNLNKEIAILQKIWNSPLVGFNSWGEIGNTQGEGCNFHNTVISAVTLTFKQKSNQTKMSHHLSQEELISLVNAEADLQPDFDLRKEWEQLQREKRILSHFLRITASDLEKEKKAREELLFNTLPESIAKRLISGEVTIADSANQVSVLFADLVGFTSLSSKLKAETLVSLLNDLFSEFDTLANRYGIEKIKTIGDAYMAVAGVPETLSDHADAVCEMAKQMFQVISNINAIYQYDLNLRVGVNSGPVIAGVIGKKKHSYDLWGKTVNMAQRMEAHAPNGSIQISTSTYDLLKHKDGWKRVASVDLKGIGKTSTYIYSVFPTKT
ncbi:adenylate/guanylate cyclase [Leptospira ryugenii]|uniref:Adenylate/guanylate cyclase n=1 Tax=Leptospira ryugenii TaxID=1917863 RepID=A0A2P2E215_9LEPT|nr:adenylate/guanylate cyclase domain-containing protein [Leptospira ryugenii]GBF50921.1 adenylate/guanylate cyclase [Leptospira ryugenii]